MPCISSCYTNNYSNGCTGSKSSGFIRRIVCCLVSSVICRFVSIVFGKFLSSGIIIVSIYIHSVDKFIQVKFFKF
jgi:hypothetical protein